MRDYIALIHKDENSDYGVSFPDLPGVISAGWSPDAGDFHFTLYGLAGFSVGLTSGLELHFAGLVAGFDPFRPALKVPAYGRVSLWDW